MRPWCVLLGALLASACDRGDYSVADARYDPAPLSSSGSEVQLADGSRLSFVITSDRYHQWDAARGRLSRAAVSKFGRLLKPASPTSRSIASATSYLESDPAARQAIEAQGMSVRDFVLMTVALEQQMRIATRRESRRPDPRPAAAEPPPVADSAPPDTPVSSSDSLGDSLSPRLPSRDSMAPQYPGPEPLRRDTARPRDSIPQRDTAAAIGRTPGSGGHADSVSRDSTPPR